MIIINLFDYLYNAFRLIFIRIIINSIFFFTKSINIVFIMILLLLLLFTCVYTILILSFYRKVNLLLFLFMRFKILFYT